LRSTFPWIAARRSTVVFNDLADQVCGPRVMMDSVARVAGDRFGTRPRPVTPTRRDQQVRTRTDLGRSTLHSHRQGLRCGLGEDHRGVARYPSLGMSSASE
jgi:hypothetical protein